MTEEKLQMFKNRLTKVYRHLFKLAQKRGISCYRIYDHDLPEFPFSIEIYGDKLYVAEYNRNHKMKDEEHERWLESSLQVMQEILAVDRNNFFVKTRRKKTGRAGQYRKLDEIKNEFVVEEQGLKFIVNLSDYLDTGLFLDHRATRQIVKQESLNKRVLNLFAYTGSFSVYAAAGGAAEVTTVDLSRTYLDWAGRNFILNDLTDQSRYHFINADVKQYLPSLAKNSFDIIVMDPPTFSNSKKMDDFLDIQRDHTVLLNDALKVLTAGGFIYFSTNYRKFEIDKAGINASDIKDITKATTPFDFEGRPGRVCFKIIK